MTILIAAAALIVMIVAHEAGHLLAARALGVRVEEFAVGQGPALVRARVGETTFSLRALPFLGGFTKMTGTLDEHDEKSFGAKTPWRKASIVAAGPIANVLLAALVLLSGHVFVTGIPPWAGLGAAASDAARLTAGLGGAAAGLLTGDGLGEAVTSLLRVVAELGLASGPTGYHLGLVALVGLYLGLFNLLPVMPLDGGRLPLVAAERLRGRPLETGTVAGLTVFGMALMVLLALFAAYEDLGGLLSRLLA